MQVQKDGETVTLTAKKEVIPAAGVFGSPKLLELSGGAAGETQHGGNRGDPNVGENCKTTPSLA